MAMSRNSFKELEQEIARRDPAPLQRIERNLRSQMEMTEFVSQILELYVTRAADTFLAMSGGEPHRAKTSDDLPEAGQAERDLID